MNMYRLVRRILIVLSIVGTVIVVVFLGFGMIQYALDPQGYAQKVAQFITIPFVLIFVVTLTMSVVAYMMPESKNFP